MVGGLNVKYLVISDNHGDREILATLFDQYRDQVDGIFHCGDSELKADDAVFKDVSVVEGNNDPRGEFSDDIERDDHGEHVFMTHGDLYGVSMGLTHLSLKAQSVNASLVFYGHTHQLAAEMVDDCLYLNPGSISLPRGTYAPVGGTYALIDTTPAIVTVTFYDRQQQPVPGLQFEFTRQTQKGR